MYRCKSIYNHRDTSHTSFQLISKQVSFCLLTASSPLLANPAGGDVVGGSATIDYGTTTVVTQHTDKAIVNWQDFSINQNETTQFVQPSSSSVILNRVVGGNASQIMGKLQANGTVFLVNPNGIVFGKDAVVDVGGLVASTASISNQHFMEGNYRFTDAPDNSSVINEGHITVAQTGYAALVAPNVENSGLIEATLGQVTLASGKTFTVDLYGDNLITLDATALVESAKVKNSGVILADGGTVTMSAAGAKSLVESVINMDGYVQARAVGTKNGKVVLLGNDNTTIKVAGKIDVSGKRHGEKGGVIQATSRYVKLESGANLNASGDAGGGTVHIGSDTFHNPNDPVGINTFGEASSLPTAQFVYAAPDAVINANSLYSGNAGDVVVWGDQATGYFGTITAAALGLSGDGGRIETSAHDLSINGIKIDASAHAGESGIWLLDPSNVIISDAADSGTYTWSNLNPDTYTPTSDSVINTTTLYDAANAANVIVTTGSGASAGNITFSNATPLLLDSNHTLSLVAANDIIFNTGTSTAINITNGATVNLRSDSDSDGSGTVTYTSGQINASGSTAAINLYYNPINFSTAVDYSTLVAGTTSLTSYMLVHDAVAGHLLSDINLNATTRGQTYALSQNISTGLGSFTPISAFTGILTGANYTGTNYSITGLTSSGSGDRGLFSSTSGATLSDLTLNNFSITSTDSGAAALVSIASNTTFSGSITINGGTITGLDIVGGLIGQINTSTITANVSSTADVSGRNYVGGLIGHMISGTISGSGTFETNAKASANTTISGVDYIGGLIGEISGGTFTRTTSSVNNNGSFGVQVSGDDSVAGLFGHITSSFTLTPTTLTNASSANSVTGTGVNVGGVIGFYEAGPTTLTSTMSNAASVSGNFRVGGVIGRIYGPLALDGNFTNTGAVTADNQVGGVIGSAGTAGVRQFYGNYTNSGTVTATGNTESAGGVFGYVEGTFGDGVGNDVILWNTGNVIASSLSRVGGVIGNSYGAEYYSDVLIKATAGQVTGGSVTGGLVGIFDSFVGFGFLGDLQLSYSTTTTFNVGSLGGGLIGAMVMGTFAPTSIIATGNITVSGANNVGGFMGSIFDTAATLPSYTNTFTVTATGSQVGGVFGEIQSNNSGNYVHGSLGNTGSITGVNNVGGVVGKVTNAAVLSDTYTHSSGTITGTSNVGGIIGYLSDASATLSNASVSSGSIVGNAQVGGIVGTNAGTLTDVLFGGILDTTGGSPTEVGGIAGSNTGTITNALAVGTYNVSAATNAGALVGNNTGTVNTSYYDTRLFATDIGTGAAGGTGYSTNADFYTQSSYIGFSFPGTWTLSGTSYYASLTFCGTGCQILLPASPTPTPTPTPTVSNNIVSGIITTIANNQSTSMLNPVADYVTTLDVQNFMNEFGDALSSLGLINSFLNDVTFFQTYSGGTDLTQQEQAAASEQDMISIIEALSNYYCGTKS